MYECQIENTAGSKRVGSSLQITKEKSSQISRVFKDTYFSEKLPIPKKVEC